MNKRSQTQELELKLVTSTTLLKSLMKFKTIIKLQSNAWTMSQKLSPLTTTTKKRELLMEKKKKISGCLGLIPGG